MGFYAGISSTDWSWTPVVQDFDNDGLRDMIITNGFAKDITDHDIIAFREKSFGQKSKREVLQAAAMAQFSVLKGDGKGKFTPLSIMQSGIYIPGSGKSLAKLKDAMEIIYW